MDGFEVQTSGGIRGASTFVSLLVEGSLMRKKGWVGRGRREDWRKDG